jgi:hypothetical protein
MFSKRLVGTLVVLGAAVSAAPAEATTYNVVNQNDAGGGSLRRAIDDANNNAGADDIQFNIAGGGLHVIHLAADLPPILDPVTIRGYSQPGAVKAAVGVPAVLKIALDASQVANGLLVQTDDSLIRGLVVHTAGNVAGAGVGVRIEGDRNRLEGSYIGLDGIHNDTFTHGNVGDGVQIEGNNNVVGGTAPEDRNVISANGKIAGTDADGVSIVGDDNKVRGNAIGTDPAMITGQIGNTEAGVRLEGDRNLVGGAVTGATNVISGNGTAVLVASGEDNKITGNLIGTDGAGDVALGNSRGVTIESPGNVVGGDALLNGNLISGTTTGAGVELLSDYNTVQGNLIGTDVWGEDALPNLTGVRVTGDANVIGGSTGFARNVVSGNLFDGISIDQPDDIDLHPVGNRVEANLIGTALNGTDALPNGDDGVSISNGRGSTIGGIDPENGNVIAFNGDVAGADGDGVNVAGGSGNSIVGNSIFGNAALGIDLGVDGVTGNDPDDLDSGANDLQNHPEITGATTTSVDWTLDSRPLTRYRIEFFGNGSSCDDSGNGEGQTFLGSTYVSTDSRGEVDDSTALTTAVAVGDLVTATATVDVLVRQVPAGPIPPLFPPTPGPAQSSEFSPCVAAT